MTDEGRVWVDEMSAIYDAYLGAPVFQPFADDLATRAFRHRPRRVLELAAGTGRLTRALCDAASGIDITATDLNPAMVDYGRRQVPEATWQQADATTLPFDDNSFDLVACQFGIMFFPDKPTAFGEVRRVLTSDGTFIANAWGLLSSHDWEAAVIAVLAELFPADPPTFLARLPHGYADEARITADVLAGGLQLASIDTVTVDGRAGSAADLARGYCQGTPLRAEITARGDLDQTTDAVATALTSRFGSGPVTGRMVAHVIEAKPR